MISAPVSSTGSLGLPPSPENAPAIININRNCALEVSGKRVECRKKVIENGCEREIPRLYRILNLPFPPRTDRSSSSDISSISIPSGRSPPCEAKKENKARSSDATTNGNVYHNRYGTFSIQEPSEKQWIKESFVSRAFGIQVNGLKHPNTAVYDKGWRWNTNSSVMDVHATFPPKERRMPLIDSDPSTLSSEQKVIRRPAPKPSLDIPQFTDRNVPISIPVASSDPPNTNGFLPSSNNGVASGTETWCKSNTPFPIQFHSSETGVASFVATNYLDEIVELRRRGIYPSSTESDWCAGKTIEYVRRRDLHSYDVVEPVIKNSTVEVAAPIPVRVDQRWGLWREN